MSSYQFSLQFDAIDQAGQRAFAETAFVLGREFTRVITEPRNWSGFEGERDIVDRGQLRSSQQLVFTDPLRAVYSWPVEYAAPVHNGYTLRNGKEVEGRPWTTIATQEFDVQAAFTERYRKNLEQI